MSGLVNGSAFAARSALANRWSIESTSASRDPGHYLLVRISERSAVCNPAGALPLRQAGKRLLDLEVHTQLADGRPTTGTYDARGSVGHLEGCVPGADATIGDIATGTGSVTLAAGDDAKGTFELSLGSGAKLSGAFDAPFCAYDWERSDKVVCAQ